MLITGHLPGYTGAVGTGREYVQGFVSLLPATPATGGNVVVPRSHRAYACTGSHAADVCGAAPRLY